MTQAATSVMVVDDSMLARMMLSSLITQFRPDWTVHPFTNGKDALAALTSLEVAYATIDFNMPEIDGLTLAQLVLAKKPEMKIALVTANIQDSIRNKAEALGLTFLPKPISDAKINALLTEWAA